MVELQTTNYKTGRWTKKERLTFLIGLRRYGKGKWKKISTMIPTRDTIQVKTHAQVIVRKWQNGADIFKELDTCERRFLSEEEEAGMEEDEKINMSALTTPTFIWKPQDFEASKALLLLKSGNLDTAFSETVFSETTFSENTFSI